MNRRAAHIVRAMLFLAVFGGILLAEDANALVCIKTTTNQCLFESTAGETPEQFEGSCEAAASSAGNATHTNPAATCAEYARQPDFREPSGAVAPTTAPATEKENGLVPADILGDIKELDRFGTRGGRTLPQILGSLVKIIVGVLGAFTLLLFIYGGITWMLAAGNSEREKKGLDTLFWGGMGIAVIFSSYALVSYIFQAFQ